VLIRISWFGNGDGYLPNVISRLAVDILTVNPATTTKRAIIVTIKKAAVPMGFTTMNSTRQTMNTPRDNV